MSSDSFVKMCEWDRLACTSSPIESMVPLISLANVIPKKKAQAAKEVMHPIKRSPNKKPCI